MPAEVMIACAGSGKTTKLIDNVLQNPNQRTLVTTYTEANRQSIEDHFIGRIGFVPPNATIRTWFEFLLADWLRPYSSTLGINVDDIDFNSKPPKFARRSNISDYYLAAPSRVYGDRASDLAARINEKSQNVLNRLECQYHAILIDEVQDLAGYDLELVHAMMKTSLNLILVGDPRQATFVSNNSLRNRQYRRSKIVDWFAKMEREGLCSITVQSNNFRCHPDICEFADNLYPKLGTSVSNWSGAGEHVGVYLVSRQRLGEYLKAYSPVILRHSKIVDTFGHPARNFGEVKGLQFDRTLLFPTQSIQDYLLSGDVKDIKDRARFYVAITRARHSASFLVDEQLVSPIIRKRW